MKTDIIQIDNQGGGFSEALDAAEKAAVYAGLSDKNAIRLGLLAQEMLSLARSITGEMKADFWIEQTKGLFELHMTTETVMDADKRSMLISTASSKKNEAAKGLLGILRDKIEQAMATPVDHSEEEVPYELMSDVGNQVYDDPEWDGFERSVLLKLADNVKITIRGGKVEIVVSKRFAD